VESTTLRGYSVHLLLDRYCETCATGFQMEFRAKLLNHYLSNEATFARELGMTLKVTRVVWETYAEDTRLPLITRYRRDTVTVSILELQPPLHVDKACISYPIGISAHFPWKGIPIRGQGRCPSKMLLVTAYPQLRTFDQVHSESRSGRFHLIPPSNASQS